MDDGSWELLKGLLHWVIYPIICFLGWLFKSQYKEVQVIKEEISKLKTDHAVVASQVQDVREDIKDLVQVVRNVEKNIIEQLKEKGK